MESYTGRKNFGNGEFADYQIVDGFSWSDLRPVYGKTDSICVAELMRLYTVNIIPKDREHFPTFILAYVPDDLDFPFAVETPAGLILDRQLCVAYWFRSLYAQGRLTVDRKKIHCTDARVQEFFDTLAARSLLYVEEGMAVGVRYQPVASTMGLLSKAKGFFFMLNSHFFLMDPLDCAGEWDKLGTPYGYLQCQGKILQPPLLGRAALMVGFDGKVRISHPRLSDISVQVGRYVFKDGKNARFFSRPAMERSPVAPGYIDLVIENGGIACVHADGDTMIPLGGFVLSYPRDEGKIEGDVSFHGFEDTVFGIQVGPPLIAAGKGYDTFDTPFFAGKGPAFPPTVYPLSWEHGRAARMAVGIIKDRPAVLWISGTNVRFYEPGKLSAGVSLSEFVLLCRSLGAEWMVNLDGGGSSGIYAPDGSHALHLADRYLSLEDAERPVPLGLGLI
jgi:hypothetical protein